MPKFVAVASTALCLCAIWATSASAINVHVPSAGLTLSAAPLCATDPIKRELYLRLAKNYRQLADDIRRVGAAKDAA